MGRSRGCAHRTLLLAAACALGATPLAAQWRLDAQAGRLQYEAAPDAVTTTLALGITRATVHSGAGLSVGVPFSDDEPVWGALYGYRRLVSDGAFRFGVDLAANGFAYRIAGRDSTGVIPLPTEEEVETGWGAAAEVMPLLAFGRGIFGAEARAGFVGYMSDASSAEAFDRSAFVADAGLDVTPFAGLTARLDARFVNVTEGGFPFAGIGIGWDGPVSLWASVGQWFEDTVDEVSWDAGGSVRLGERVALSVSGRHDPIDPVYGTPSRTTWGAGVTLWLGDAAAIVTEPVPARYERGVATVVLDDDDVDEATPSIAGDFNGWTPTPMQRIDDAWVHRVPLAPGVYHYAFVDADGNWFVPEGTPGRRSDGMGGWVAVLVIADE